jgi:Protein of unknown function (DUF3667)
LIRGFSLDGPHADWYTPASALAADAKPAMAVTEEADVCASCGTGLQGRFCSRCGEKKLHDHEFALRHFAAHALHELTHLDAKVFTTVRYLFTRPGYLTTEYIAGRRSRYMKPLSLFLVAVALMFLADSIHPQSVYNMQWIMKRDKDGKMNAAWEKLAAAKHQPKELIIEQVQERIHRVVTVVQFANVLGMAAILLLMYRKRYFVEHVVIAFHYLAFLYLCSILSWPLDAIVGSGWKHLVISLLKLAVWIWYLFLALRRVYRQKAAITWVKAIVTYAWVQLVLILTPIVTLAGAVVAAAKS